MDAPKIREIISIYRKYLKEWPVVPRDLPHNLRAPSSLGAYAHCLGMLDKMEKFLEEGRFEKAMRWLGFIQGVFWCTGAFSLEELMNHSRPDEATTERLADSLFRFKIID